MSAGRPQEGERGERGGSPLGETPGAAEELRSGDRRGWVWFPKSVFCTCSKKNRPKMAKRIPPNQPAGNGIGTRGRRGKRLALGAEQS